MSRKTTLAAGAGGSVTFNSENCGHSLITRNHTVVVADAVVTYDVDILVGGKWIRVASATDVLAADITVLDQVGFDQVKVTATAAGDVTLVHWGSV